VLREHTRKAREGAEYGGQAGISESEWEAARAIANAPTRHATHRQELKTRNALLRLRPPSQLRNPQSEMSLTSQRK